jgi:phytoene dehydrogenase-like protein
MAKKIIIIGGGVAGLSAGIFARKNGFESLIIEQHFLPGGLCTAWERKGYVFDGCLSYLYGTGEGQPFNDLWRNLGVADLDYIHRDEFIRVRNPDGQDVVAWADPDRLYEHLTDISPADKPVIADLCRAVKKFTKFDLSALGRKPRELMTLLDTVRLGLEMTPWAADTMKWSLTGAEDFARRFKEPVLKEAVPHLFGWPEIPMLAGIAMLSYIWKKNAGFPALGSLAFARALEKTYTGLGGEIQYKKRVDRILTENGKAVGVRLYSDEDIRADYVISTADGKTTSHDMLDGEYGRKTMQRRYNGDLPIHSQMQVSLGVSRDMSDTPSWIIHLLKEPFRLLSEERSILSVKNFSFAPELSPDGKHVVEVFLRMNYRYFQRIYGNRLYNSEQEQTADQILGALERVHPGIRDDIELIDVATPISYERYTGNWQGSSCGWLLTKKTMLWMIKGVKKTLGGLKNLYMAGQWVEPGGSVPNCCASGRNAVMLICRDAGRKFNNED